MTLLTFYNCNCCIPEGNSGIDHTAHTCTPYCCTVNAKKNNCKKLSVLPKPARLLKIENKTDNFNFC